MKTRNICLSELRNVVMYSPFTGDLYWKVSRSNKVAGSLATCTCLKDGYKLFWFEGTLHRAHRIAWLLIHGYLPEFGIDHKDGDRENNKLPNLREVAQSCNAQNCRVSKNNTSGYPGVSFDSRRGLWVAQAMLHRKHVYLGRHCTALEAALVRFTWEVWCMSWECNSQSKLRKAIRDTWLEFNG